MRAAPFSLLLILLAVGCGSTEQTALVAAHSELDADADADTDADTDADADADGSDTADTGHGETGEPTGPLDDCVDDLIGPLTWFDGESMGSIEGGIEYGQTHVIKADETRWAPSLIEGRAAMFLFTPTETIDESSDVRLAGWKDGALLGVLPMSPPGDLPSPLEQDLTLVELDPWSDTAWSAFLPWTWVQEGTELTIGTEIDGELLTREHTLIELGAPHRFTMSRSKMVLFGEPEKSTFTYSGEQIGQDFYGSLPASHLRWVDSAPWRLNEIVVRAEHGPVLVDSEGERLAVTSDPDRWHIIKHQFSIRMSLANTGRGLSQTTGGDSSPYSFGTSVGSGWVMNDDGSYSDLDNAPYAAGWTGWTAMWLGECANVFIHEIGHSCTLLHFTGGTAASWGIGDEYPADGTNVATHPWGFDTTRERFRTWYRVNNSGPVEASPGIWQGKNDPMNGGEGANATNCFPQYTGFHGWKIQHWSETSPTITSVDGVPGVYTWDPDARAYMETGPVQAGSQNPVAIDVPVATVIGALAHLPEASRIYTPIYWSSGNVFEVPEATEPGLHEVFEGATYYLKIDYADGSAERMLIARPNIEDTDSGLYLFSVNVELDRNPTQASLYQTMDGYPDMDFSTPSLIHTMDFEEPIDVIPEPILLGQGFLANGALRVTDWCEPGLNCDARSESTAWRWSETNLHFTGPDGEADDTLVCGETDGHTSLDVPVVNEDGETDTLVLHAQRTIAGGGHRWAGPINDTTTWIDMPNVKQGLRVWIPYEDNASLGTGTWTNDGEWGVTALSDGAVFANTPIEIELTVLPAESIDISVPFEGPSVTRDGTSTFFSVADGTMGPTSGTWWGSSSYTPLTIPVRDGETGEMTTLQMDAWKRSCNLGWGTQWNFNSAQVADGTCGQWPNLALAAEGNEHLVTGHTYSSPPSWPLVVRGHAWHWGQAIVETTAYQIEYTAP